MSTAFVIGLSLAAVAATGTTPPDPPAVRLPPVGAVVDSQLGGPYPPDDDVTVVFRDRTAAPVAGRYDVCYVNGFQTQPEELAWWEEHHRDLLVRDEDGEAVIDPDWPDEAILDPTGPARRRRLVAVVGAWIDGCARDGFDAVELDNLDTFTRFPDHIAEADAVAYARALVDRAHEQGLAIGQKNTAELLPRRDELGFDFAVVEECGAFDECEAFADAYGGRAYDIEYDDEGFAAACAVDVTISVVRRDRDLTPRGSPGYVRRTC